MAPEQASGNSQDIGTPTDVHALGVLLYECLTGAPPFHGDNSYATMEQVRFREPPPPGRGRKGISRDLDTICLKCLRKEPARRYASAEELADDLRRYLNGEPIQARRTGLLGRASRWCRRNPALAITLSVAVLAIAIVTSFGLFRIVEERERYRTERDVAQANLYRALLGEARAQMKARDTGWWWLALENLREARRLDIPIRDTIELRDLAVECMGSDSPCFRLRDTWSGHDGPVTSIACSPDGRRIASGSKDNTVRLWSSPEGQPLAVLRGHAKAVTGVVFSPDGQTLASSSTDGTVRLWTVDHPDLPPRVVDFQADPVQCLAFSPDGRWLAAGCRNGSVRLVPISRTPDGRTEVALTGHTDAVTCLAFSYAGELASGSDDRTIRFWDTEAGKQKQSWPVSNPVSCVAYSQKHDNHFVAWGNSEARMMFLRNRFHDTQARQIQPHASGVTHVDLYMGNTWLMASADGTIKLWLHQYSWLSEVAVARGDFRAVLACTLTPSREHVVAGYRDGRIRIWDVATPPQQSRYGTHSHHGVFAGHDRQLVDSLYVTDFAASREGTYRSYAPAGVRGIVVQSTSPMMALGREDGTIETWDRIEQRELSHWQAHDRSISSLAGSPDGQRLASASLDGTVKIWQTNLHRLDHTLNPQLGELHAIAWSRDGETLVVSGERGVVAWDLERIGSPRRLSDRSLAASSVAFGASLIAYSEANGAINLIDRKTGVLRRQLTGHLAAVVSLEFSPDGQRLASGAGDGTARLWDVATGREEFQFRFPAVSGVLIFHPGGRYIAYANSAGFTLYDLRERKESASLFGAIQPTIARFTPDGGTLLMGTRVGAVLSSTMAEVEQAIDLAIGKSDPAAQSGAVRFDVRTTLVRGGHTFGTWGITASPDGRWVATASHDHSVKLWDAATMRLVRTFEGHDEFVWAVAFSPDSRTLASVSGDIRLWDVETGRQVQHILGNDKLISSLAFHPNRPWLASSCYDGTVRIWDVPTGRPLHLVHKFDQQVHGVAFSPDGHWMVATDDTRLALWPVGDEPPQGPPQRLLTGHTATIWSVLFSPDGKYLASGSELGTVMLWDGATFDRLVTLRSGAGQIRGLSFSRDCKLLAAAGYTTSTAVWDLPKLRQSLKEMDLDW